MPDHPEVAYGLWLNSDAQWWSPGGKNRSGCFLWERPAIERWKSVLMRDAGVPETDLEVKSITVQTIADEQFFEGFDPYQTELVRAMFGV